MAKGWHTCCIRIPKRIGTNCDTRSFSNFDALQHLNRSFLDRGFLLKTDRFAVLNNILSVVGVSGTLCIYILWLYFSCSNVYTAPSKVMTYSTLLRISFIYGTSATSFCFEFEHKENNSWMIMSRQTFVAKLGSTQDILRKICSDKYV